MRLRPAAVRRVLVGIVLAAPLAAIGCSRRSVDSDAKATIAEMPLPAFGLSGAHDAVLARVQDDETAAVERLKQASFAKGAVDGPIYKLDEDLDTMLRKDGGLQPAALGLDVAPLTGALSKALRDAAAASPHAKTLGGYDFDASPGLQTPVKMQSNAASCTAFALAAVIESLWNDLPNRPGPSIDFDLPEQQVWPVYGSGANMVAALDAMRDHGASPAPGFAFGITSWRDAQKEGIASIINALRGDTTGGIAQPVPLAVQLTRQWLDRANGGVIDSSIPADPKLGAHALAVVGLWFQANLPSGGVMIFKNSFGLGWGRGGYGFLPIDYCDKHSCWYFRAEGAGPKPI